MNSNERILAEQILQVVGSKDNIAAATFCMTRLRLTLVDQNKANLAELKALKGVIGIRESAGQLQIILGPGIVNQIAKEFSLLTGIEMGEIADLKAQIDDKNHTPFKLFLRRLSSIFVPLIPAIVASGMIAGLTNIAIRLGADPTGAFISILNVTGWGLFSYLAIFVGINAAKEFGGTPAMGGLAGVLLINPAISTVTLYKAALVPGRGGIIGVLIVAWFMSEVEKRVRRFVHTSIDIIVTPALTLLITAFTTYFILQPIGGYIADAIVIFFKTLLSSGGIFAGFILAGTFLPVVMTGLHQGLVPVHMEFLNTLLENPLLPILAMAGAGQVGAAFAVYLKTKNNRLKTIIKGSLPVGLLGIGEPLIFGVTLPLGRPFFTACIGAGFGGAYQALTHVSSIAMGVSGLPLAFLIKSGSIVNYLIGLLIAYAAGFIVTWLVGFEDLPDT